MHPCVASPFLIGAFSVQIPGVIGSSNCWRSWQIAAAQLAQLAVSIKGARILKSVGRPTFGGRDAARALPFRMVLKPHLESEAAGHKN